MTTMISVLTTWKAVGLFLLLWICSSVHTDASFPTKFTFTDDSSNNQNLTIAQTLHASSYKNWNIRTQTHSNAIILPTVGPNWINNYENDNKKLNLTQYFNDQKIDQNNRTSFENYLSINEVKKTLTNQNDSLDSENTFSNGIHLLINQFGVTLLKQLTLTNSKCRYFIKQIQPVNYSVTATSLNKAKSRRRGARLKKASRTNPKDKNGPKNLTSVTQNLTNSSIPIAPPNVAYEFQLDDYACLNQLISPSSIANLLFILYFSSDGTTKIQIAKTLLLASQAYTTPSTNAIRYHNDTNPILLSNLYADNIEDFSIEQQYKTYLSESNKLRSAGNEVFTGQTFLFQNDKSKQSKLSYTNKTETNDANISTDLNLEFLHWLEASFGINVSQADFANEPNQVVTRINDWVSNVTHSHIQNMITSDKLNALTRMLILDATYFSGVWHKAFNTIIGESYSNSNANNNSLSSTIGDDGNFYLTPTVKIKTDMMRVKGQFKSGYVRDLDAQFVEIPFNQSDLSFYIILPNYNDGNDLMTLTARLTAYQLELMFEPLPKFDMRIEIPKFSVQESLDLKKPLTNLGLEDIFNPNKANFSKLLAKDTNKQQVNAVNNNQSNLTDSNINTRPLNMQSQPLYVSDFIHKSAFTINEKGAVGAASTQAIIEARASIEDEFIANKPFLYLVRDNRVKTLLFLGSMTKPTENI